jgi:hypothetical protein
MNRNLPPERENDNIDIRDTAIETHRDRGIFLSQGAKAD